MDFKSFKKSRGKLKESVKKMKESGTKFKKDERFFNLTKDDSGNSNALIRFLPQPDLDKPPTISFFQHGFQEKGKWFIDNCPSTFQNPCPVCEYIQPYWDEDTEESHNYARRYSRTKQFIANILVIKDTVNPANNGKVFLYKFGVKLYNKIEEKLFPESELDEQLQVFDPWEGANFKLKLRQVKKRNNYDNSEFVAKTGPVAPTDEQLEVIFNQMMDLDEFLADDKFPEYDKMTAKFNRIMKIKTAKTTPKAKTAAEKAADDSLLDDFEDDVVKDEKPATKPVQEATQVADDDFDFSDDETIAEEPKKDATPAAAADDDSFDFDDDDDFSFED